MFLIFKFYESDLKREIRSSATVDIDFIAKVGYQLLDAVAHLHEKKIMHRDIKPHNILLDKDKNIVLADFGLARTFTNPVRPYTKDVSKILNSDSYIQGPRNSAWL